MKMLVSIGPFPSHVGPCLPLLAEAVARGHRVVVCSHPRFARSVRKVGARFVPLPDDALRREVGDHRGIASLRAEVIGNFVGPALAQSRALDEIADVLQPDLFVSDVGVAGSLFVDGFAQREGRRIPWALIGFVPLTIRRGAPPFGLALRPGNGLFHRARDLVAERLVDRLLLRDLRAEIDRVRRERGLGPIPSPALDHLVESPDLYLQGTVEEFEYPRRQLPPSVHFVGPYLPPAQTDVPLPEWWARTRRGQRVVFVTQGRVDTDPAKLIIPTLRALADQDVFVVATTGGGKVDPALVPANAVVVDYVPYDLIMRSSDVVVTNAGYGGVQCALRHGVPLVVAGRTQEKGETCARVAWAGVGVDLRSDRPTTRAVRSAIARVLEQPRYAERARRLGAAMSRTDACATSLALMTELVRRMESARNRPAALAAS